MAGKNDLPDGKGPKNSATAQSYWSFVQGCREEEVVLYGSMFQVSIKQFMLSIDVAKYCDLILLNANSLS